MLHVFIDTNVYLTFFSFAEDDLEELRKLRVAIENGDVKLWVTSQTRDELKRNQEGKVAESMQALRKLKPTGGIPQMARNLPEFETFLQARRDFDGHLNTLAEQLTQQATTDALAADRVLGELMDVAEAVTITGEMLNAARRRVDLGNPPGKKGSLGDAINWEALLAVCPAEEDLYLVTADTDFVSRMDSERVSAFLADEWRRKGSEVRLYKRISALFRDKFPDIQLASEFEKELRVSRLVESQSFERTHSAIAALSSYTDFSEQEARDLLDGAKHNSQIRWIAHDADVQAFFARLIDAHRDSFEPEEVATYERLFGLGDDRDDDPW